MTLIETAIVIIVLSIFGIGFQQLVSKKLDNWHKKETLRRMKVLENEMIDYLARTYADKMYLTHSGFWKIPASTFRGGVHLKEKSGGYFEDRIYMNVFPGHVMGNNTKNKDFTVLYSFLISHYPVFFHIKQFQNYISYYVGNSILQYYMFSRQYSLLNNQIAYRFNNYNNPIVFSICEEGVFKKKQSYCRAVHAGKFFYKMNHYFNKKNQAKNHIIKVDFITQKNLQSDFRNAIRYQKYHTIFANKFAAFSGLGNWIDPTRFTTIVTKKLKNGDLIWDKQYKNLFQFANDKLIYQGSLNNTSTHFQNLYWVQQISAAQQPGLYVSNGNQGKIIEIDQHQQSIIHNTTQDKEVIFDKSQGNLKIYDQKNDQWFNAKLEHYQPTVATALKDIECGGLPCAIPGIRKCGPPRGQYNITQDIYGRYIVNDIIYNKLLIDSLSNVQDKTKTWLNYRDQVPDGLYLVNDRVKNYFYDLKDFKNNNLNDVLIQRTGSTWYYYNNNRNNIQNIVTENNIKTYEICIKGVGVFAPMEGLFLHDTPSIKDRIVNFAAIIDDDLSIDDTYPNNKKISVPNKTSFLQKNLLKKETFGIQCMQNTFPSLFYQDISSGRLNTLVNIYSNKPFAITINNKNSQQAISEEQSLEAGSNWHAATLTNGVYDKKIGVFNYGIKNVNTQYLQSNFFTGPNNGLDDKDWITKYSTIGKNAFNNSQNPTIDKFLKIDTIFVNHILSLLNKQESKPLAIQNSKCFMIFTENFKNNIKFHNQTRYMMNIHQGNTFFNNIAWHNKQVVNKYLMLEYSTYYNNYFTKCYDKNHQGILNIGVGFISSSNQEKGWYFTYANTTEPFKYLNLGKTANYYKCGVQFLYNKQLINHPNNFTLLSASNPYILIGMNSHTNYIFGKDYNWEQIANHYRQFFYDRELKKINFGKIYTFPDI